ncbi:hypothetical protein GCM10009563_31440 [Subtercola frigoramans]
MDDRTQKPVQPVVAADVTHVGSDHPVTLPPLCRHTSSTDAACTTESDGPEAKCSSGVHMLVTLRFRQIKSLWSIPAIETTERSD